MQLNIEVQAQRAQRLVAQIPRQARFAGAQALNGAAFQLRADWRAEMARVFDRPKPYVLDSIWVGRKARPDSLQAWVYPRDAGGKGVDPEKSLLAEVFGGRRRAKRFEVALQRAGILPPGFAAVPARWLVADPASGDGHGGVNGPFIVRLLSYLRAFGEQGYRANMTDKGRAKVSGRGRWIDGRFRGAHTKAGASGRGAYAYRKGGVDYFVSRGRGEYTGRGSWQNGQQQRLAAGIWQRTGTHGSDLKPVFLFTPLPRYRVRLQLAELAQQAMTVHLPSLYAAAFQRAMESAR